MTQVVSTHSRTREPSFDAAVASTVTLWRQPVFLFEQRQRIMAPFAGNAIGASEYALVNDNATAHAGSQDDPEYNFCAISGTIDCLRESETVGIIGQADLAL